MMNAGRYDETQSGFQDRTDAGQQLAGKLMKFKDRTDAIVLALPRGGVPVAYEVATILHLPLDVLVVRKLGTPGYEEMAMGAIASGGVQVLNSYVINQLNITDEAIDRVTKRERQELQRREKKYRGNRPFPTLEGKIVILIDDGLATGATMAAAVHAVQEYHPAYIVVAVPVASPETCADFEDLVDEVVCVLTPPSFRAVGSWYNQFPQTTDEQVRDYLQRAMV